MDAFGQDLHLQHAAGHAAQAGGEPELVVVAGAAVQADHQAHVAQPGAQHVHVGQQVGRAALFAGFDQADDARVRHALRLERLDGRDAGVDRVAVVGATAAIQLAVINLGRPGAEVAAPAGELGLFVEVAVHQHRLARGGNRCAVFPGARRHLEEQHRRARYAVAIVQPNDFQRQALDLLRAHPVGCVLQHPLQQAVRGPSRGRTWATWRAPRCSAPARARCARARRRRHGFAARRVPAAGVGAGGRSWG